MRGAEGVAPGRRGSEGLWKGDLQGRGLDELGDGLAVEGLPISAGMLGLSQKICHICLSKRAKLIDIQTITRSKCGHFD